MFGQGGGCGCVAQVFQVVGAADRRHGLDQLFALVFDAWVEQERLPYGIQAPCRARTQTRQVVLADEDFQRKLGGIAPKQQIVAQAHAVKSAALSYGVELTQKLEGSQWGDGQAGHLPLRQRLRRSRVDIALAVAVGLEDAAPRQG